MKTSVSFRQPLAGGFLLQPIPLLRFHAQGADLAMDARRVEDIVGAQLVCRIMEGAYLKGTVAPFRRGVIPVVDLRTTPSGSEAHMSGCPMIVLSLQRRLVGIIVDSIHGTVEMQAIDVDPIELNCFSRTDYVAGVIDSGTGKVLVVDIEKLLFPLK
jgi:chemotaxis signal transduction protein